MARLIKWATIFGWIVLISFLVWVFSGEPQLFLLVAQKSLLAFGIVTIALILILISMYLKRKK